MNLHSQVRSTTFDKLNDILLQLLLMCRWYQGFSVVITEDGVVEFCSSSAQKAALVFPKHGAPLSYQMASCHPNALSVLPFGALRQYFERMWNMTDDTVRACF